MKLNGMGHISLGVLGLFLTFYVSLLNNTWLTALLWSIFGFIFFWLAGYGIRFFLKQIFAFAPPAIHEVAPNEQPQREPFQSISLASLHHKTDTERITETIRAWTNEEREG